MADYIDSIGDARLVIDMLAGAQQRLMIYPQQGFMVEQPVPEDVAVAFERLRAAGFTSRLVAERTRHSRQDEQLRVSVPLRSVNMVTP
ncbi:hypothetical protein GCM10017776_38280 [Streptomyces griseoluteus]|nr:hypothetical protein GCM10017776_38280 [Streptomyces griseoluteus]